MKLRKLRRTARKGHASTPVRLPPPPIPPEVLARRHQELCAQQAKAEVIQKTMAPGTGVAACPHCGAEPKTIARDRASGVWQAKLAHTPSCPARGGFGDVVTAALEQERPPWR